MEIKDLLPRMSAQYAHQELLRWKIRYILTEEAAIPRDRIQDPDSTFGREFESIVYIEEYPRGEYAIADYTYPYSKQSDEGWMMTGRVVADWSKVNPLSITSAN